MHLLRVLLAGPRFTGRAAVGFGLVTAITALTAVGSAFFARNAFEKRERILAAYTSDLTHASQAQLAAETMVAVGRGYFLAADPELLRRFRTAEAKLESSLTALGRAGVGGRERELLDQARESALQYRNTFDESLVDATAQGPSSWVRSFSERLLPAREELGTQLEKLVEHKKDLQAGARLEARRTDAKTFGVMVSFAVAGTVLSILLALAFIRHLAGIYRRERESAAAATRASAAREELLGVVAHDLRNPLNALLLKAALIRRGADDFRIRGHAESIENLAIRMEAFIHTLLDAASIEAGRLSVSWKRCSAAEVLAATKETFGALATSKTVRLDYDLGRSDLAFWGDPERILQVLSNLVGNALKFTPPGGRVMVRAVESGFHTRFEVRDTGPGIPSHYLPRVFERFWRAEAGERQGTGLGLYIAKGIVEGHRGRIWVESRVGTGSAFIFELPTPSGPILSEGAEEGHELGERPHS